MSIPESTRAAIDAMDPEDRRALLARLRLALAQKEKTMPELTDADRRAVAERQARIRRANGFDDRGAAPYPDALLDPVGFLAQLDAEEAADELAEVVALANAPAKDESYDDLITAEIARLNRTPSRK